MPPAEIIHEGVEGAREVVCEEDEVKPGREKPDLP